MNKVKSFAVYSFLCVTLLYGNAVAAGIEYAIVHWNGSADGAWSTQANWTTDESSFLEGGSSVVPDKVLHASASSTTDGCLGFAVVFDDRGAARTTVNVDSGDVAAGLNPFTQDLDLNSINLQSLEFVTRDGGGVTPSYEINLSGANMSTVSLRNTSGVAQTINIPATQSLSSDGVQSMTIVNNGEAFLHDIDDSTITNNASSAVTRGILHVTPDSSDEVSDSTIINNGGASWFYGPQLNSVDVSTSSIRNKISSGGVPGYFLIAANMNFDEISLGFDVNSNTNGFGILSRGVDLNVGSETLTLYLDPTATYNGEVRTLIYKNGEAGGSLSGEFALVIKDTSGNTLSNAQVSLDYTEGSSESTPEGAAIPSHLSDTLGATLLPILRATITYSASQVQSLTEETRGHMRGISTGMSKSLERVRTAVHKIVSSVAHASRQKSWHRDSFDFNARKFGNLEGVSTRSLTAPSLEGSYLSNTTDMMGAATRETLGRFAPLRTAKTGIWAQPFGQIVEQASRAGRSGYTSKTAGILFGMDHRISENLLVGGGIGSANSTSELKSNNSKGKILDRFGTLFASWNNRQWYVETLVTGALNRFRSGRVIDANTVAGNQHKGYQIVPSLGAGCRIGMLNDLWILVPSLTASLIYSHEDGYTETGGGSNNQRINGRCSSQLRTEGGFSISRHKNYKNVQALYTVGLKAILQEPLKKGDINGSVGSNSFGVSHNDQREVYGGINFSAEFQLRDDWFIDAHYTGEFGSGLANHETALRIGRRF